VVFEGGDTRRKSLLQGILEEVTGFANLSKSGMFMLQSPLDYFVGRLREILGENGTPLYTGIEAIEVDSSVWVDVPRPRTVPLRIAFGALVKNGGARTEGLSHFKSSSTLTSSFNRHKNTC
jgi:hypothetical protein